MIDRVEIHIKGGDGGDGAISGHREKYVPRGGPDGGDGGGGGGIHIVSDENTSTLLDYRYRRHFTAGNGMPGLGKNRHGRDGRDITLRVPVGTQIWIDEASAGSSGLLADLDSAGERVTAARGGSGGAGNARFATSTNRFPRLASAGEQGEELTLRLELKLLADVGIIGAPNAGKSSLLSVVSAARPKIADYPFTTLEPSLGVVRHSESDFVMVDIPGLIEGAHAGVGLGHEFLRHVERTRVLVHLVDGSQDDPVGRYTQINAELSSYAEDLARKPQILAINKLDLTDVSVLRDDIHEAFMEVVDEGTEIYFVSAATRAGVDTLLDAVSGLLAESKQSSLQSSFASPLTDSEYADVPILRPEAVRRRPAVAVGEDGSYVVDWPPAERMAVMIDPEDWDARMQFYNRLMRNGVIRALEEAGVGPGDVVRIGDVEWVWE